MAKEKKLSANNDKSKSFKPKESDDILVGLFVRIFSEFLK
jgi:hypothetical protein